MNAAQTRLLRWEENEWRKVRRAQGKPADNAARHTLYRSAFGSDKSSKHFTNDELAFILAKLRAETQSANFDAQMHAQQDAEIRAADLRAEIERLAITCGIKHGLAGVSSYFRRWLAGRAVEQLEERDLQKLAGMLLARVKQLAGYYSHETRERVERLFLSAHPVFGSAAKEAPTAVEAFAAGKASSR